MGMEKVSALERCPHFWGQRLMGMGKVVRFREVSSFQGSLIEGFHCGYSLLVGKRGVEGESVYMYELLY